MDFYTSFQNTVLYSLSTAQYLKITHTLFLPNRYINFDQKSNFIYSLLKNTKRCRKIVLNIITFHSNMMFCKTNVKLVINYIFRQKYYVYNSIFSEMKEISIVRTIFRIFNSHESCTNRLVYNLRKKI